MIEIIKEDVVMPEPDLRRFQYSPKDRNGRKWNVTDTEQGRIIYTGKYENSALICHNLNKKHYRDAKVPVNKS